MEGLEEIQRAYQNATLITSIVELWSLCQSSPPHANHIQVHVGMEANISIVTILGKT